MAYSSKTEVHWFINKDQHLWLDFLHHIRNDPRNDKLDLIALYTMWKQQTKSKFILLLSYRLGVHLPSGFLGGRIELKRDAVNTVSLVGRRLKPLPFEYVPQVSSTSSTCDLCPPPIRVRLMFNKKKHSLILEIAEEAREQRLFLILMCKREIVHTVCLMAPGSPS